jgi:hypothetical protein
MNLIFLYILTAIIVGTFLYYRWGKKTENASFFALVAFYFFLFAGIPWYHIRTAQMKFSDVNDWFFFVAIILGTLHFIFKPNAKKPYLWLAVISIVGSILFLITRKFGYPYFFPI